MYCSEVTRGCKGEMFGKRRKGELEGEKGRGKREGA